MLGDFNFPNIDWSCSTTSCPMADPLVDLAGLLFLAPQVKEPTRKHILNLIFCPDDLVNYISTTDTFLSNHRIIHVSTSIPVPQTIPVAQSLIPSSNGFEKIDFNRADWSQLEMSLNNIDWEHELYQLSTEMYLPFAINIIAEKFMLLTPKKSGKKKRISMFHRKRIILITKRRKLVKSHKSDCDKNAQIMHLK